MLAYRTILAAVAFATFVASSFSTSCYKTDGGFGKLNDVCRFKISNLDLPIQDLESRFARVSARCCVTNVYAYDHMVIS